MSDERCSCWTTDPHTNRAIVGVEQWGVYDGTLFYFCPLCGRAFQRFDDLYMQAKAQPFIDAENAAQTSALKRHFEEIVDE